MRILRLLLPVLLFPLVYAACKDPYIPRIDALDREILVVEGFIDGRGPTQIDLSRVKAMNGADTAFEKYVDDAHVQVEDNQGNVYPIFHVDAGRYEGYFGLNPEYLYRIRIFTTNGKEYESAFVPYKVSPPIDEVYYRVEQDGARILVSTHDVENRSKYYRWKYEETWQFQSAFMAFLQFDHAGEKVVKLQDSIYDCWQFDLSREILINSTESLREDVMKDVPLLLIPNGSIKLSHIYSINVKQYVMDSSAFNYYRQLKKNTEEVGSIFDPQPGNLKGNIKNIQDPKEVVVGYIGAGSSVEKRTFFRIPWNYKESCRETVFVPNVRDSIKYYFRDGGYWPISLGLDELGQEGYVAAPIPCVDCRLKGTNVKPAFWP